MIIGRAQEEFMLGTTYQQVRTSNPKLDQLLVDSMVSMCSMMMAMAIAYLSIAWFGARRGARWAPWVLLVSGVVWVPFYFIIARDMAAFGAPDASMAAGMAALFALPAALGSALMLVDQRRLTTTARGG